MEREHLTYPSLYLVCKVCMESAIGMDIRARENEMIVV